MKSLSIFKKRFFITLGFLAIFYQESFAMGFLFGDKEVSKSVNTKMPTFKAPDFNFFEKLKENLKFFTLENGMEVILYKNTDTPQVLTKMAYRVGSAHENSAERGMAHLVEHMIFKGTKEKMSECDLDKICVKFGAETNAFTSYDYTAYWFLSDLKNYPVFLDILSDCAQNAKFDPEHLASELKAVVQELNWGRDKYEVEAGKNCLKELFPPNHGYHFEIIGFAKELAEMKASNLKHFFEKFYHPANATLFVVGNIDFETVESEVKKSFGSWKGGKPRNDVVQPKVIGDTCVSEKAVYRATSLATMIHYFYVPGVQELESYIHLGFLTKIITSESGRLTRRLVDELELATGVGQFGWQMKEGGSYGVMVQSTEQNVAKCAKIVQEELERLFNDGVTEEEVALAKPLLVTREVEKFENMFGMNGPGSEFAYEMMELYFATGDPYKIFEIVKIYSSVTAADINKTIKKWLNPLIVKKYSILPIKDGQKKLWASFDEKIKADQAEILANHKRTALLEVPRLFNTLGSPELYQYTVPKADKKVILDNGLCVIVKCRPLAPFVHVELESRDFQFIRESIDTTEASVAGACLIEASEGFDKEKNLKFFDSIGAHFDFGDDKSTLAVCSSNFEDGLAHFAHVILNPRFQEKNVRKIASILSQKQLQLTKNEKAVAGRAFRQALFPNTSYDWTFQDCAKRLDGISLNAVKEAYEKFFQPQNYVLCIVGDVPQNWQELVKKNFGTWQGLSKEFVKRPVILPKAPSNSTPILCPLEKDQVLCQFGRPSTVTVTDPERPRLKLLNKLVFGSLGSKLFEVREQTGLFYTASGAIANDSNKDYSFDTIAARLNPGNIGKFKKAVSEMFKEIVESPEPFNKDLIDGAKHFLLNSTVESLTTNGGLLDALITQEILGLGDDFYQKTLDIISKTTAEDLSKLARKYCNFDQMVEIHAGGLSKKHKKTQDCEEIEDLD